MNKGRSLLDLVVRNAQKHEHWTRQALDNFNRGAKRTIVGPTKHAYKGNPWKHFIMKTGDKPRYLQAMQGKNRGPLLLVMFLMSIPIIATPFYMDYWINKHREEGHPLLDKYEAQLREKRVRKQKDDAVVVEEEEVLAHSATAADQEQIKAHYKYVLIGGGTASHAAMKEILSRDPNAEILIVSEDPHRPYERPPLSKELWKSSDPKVAETLKFKNWRGHDASVFYENDIFYKENSKVTLLSGKKVIKLDISQHLITVDDGSVYKFDKCLLATGGTPRVVPGYENFPDRVTTFRTIDDFKKLDKISQQGGDVVVVGGSFLGTELSYALAQRRMGTVTQVFLEPVPLARNLPRYLSQSVRNTLEDVGVQLKPNRNVTQIEQGPDGKLVVRLDSGEVFSADYVLTATGIFPNTELAESAGLEIDSLNGGIMTNAELEARNGVFVAGDVLSYHDTALGRRRVEHHDHATSTGRLAGKNMTSTGNKVPFEYLSMFWSDVGELHFEAVGEINSSLNTYAVFNGVQVRQNGAPWNHAPAPLRNSGFKKGVVYYMQDNRVVGVLMWNLNSKALAAARRVVMQKQQYKNPEELANLIDIDMK